ncbi:uncharacterized protein LODBEIA_P55750 [Lodderomyces beijingensis]|uniref:Uncharacterized protein n=1 Tax=Lodderomyces beijingensis TaxID=1775926 RepID=A0ABP0ZT95_9ASCO
MYHHHHHGNSHRNRTVSRTRRTSSRSYSSVTAPILAPPTSSRPAPPPPSAVSFQQEQRDEDRFELVQQQLNSILAQIQEFENIALPPPYEISFGNLYSTFGGGASRPSTAHNKLYTDVSLSSYSRDHKSGTTNNTNNSSNANTTDAAAATATSSTVTATTSEFGKLLSQYNKIYSMLVSKVNEINLFKFQLFNAVTSVMQQLEESQGVEVREANSSGNNSSSVMKKQRHYSRGGAKVGSNRNRMAEIGAGATTSGDKGDKSEVARGIEYDEQLIDEMSRKLMDIFNPEEEFSSDNNTIDSSFLERKPMRRKKAG